MFSIIVPVYNAEKYLHRCIDSILAQTFTNYELLLINDGSKDNSGAICDEYAAKDSRVRVFHKENGGVGSARNMGLDNAKGEWITFVDSDDYVLKNYLQNYISQIDDKVDLLCQGFECDKYFSDEFPIKKCGIDYYGDVQKGIQELYRQPMPGAVWNKCFKTKIIEEQSLRFDKNIVLKEDEIFVLNYLKYCLFITHSKKSGYFYFVPQWGAKYIIQKENYYNIEKKIYEIQSVILENKCVPLLSYTLYDLTAAFINALPNCKNKRSHVLDYKKCVGKNILKSQLFTLSKWLIFLDKTGYFSTLFLKIHQHIKSKISKP